jgi:hypothetical protein
MNERIKELFGEALDKAVPETWSVLNHEQMTEVSRVFAELIVRDCALIAGLMEHEGRKNIGANILDSFGI